MAELQLKREPKDSLVKKTGAPATPQIEYEWVIYDGAIVMSRFPDEQEGSARAALRLLAAERALCGVRKTYGEPRIPHARGDEKLARFYDLLSRVNVRRTPGGAALYSIPAGALSQEEADFALEYAQRLGRLPAAP